MALNAIEQYVQAQSGKKIDSNFATFLLNAISF